MPSIIGCLVIQLCVGILYIWSVLRKEFPASFALPADSTLPAMVTSYMILAFVVGNFAGGFINDKKGPRTAAFIGVVMFSLGIGATGLLTSDSVNLIILTYCVLGGLGSGIAYGACISCIQKWLPHRRGLASGLAVSSFGLSTVVFAPVSEWLMNAFRSPPPDISSFSSAFYPSKVDFAPVFFILAGVFFVFGFISCFFVKLPDKAYLDTLPAPAAGSKVVASKRDYTLGQAARTVPFWCLFLYIFFINGTWNLTAPLIRTLGEQRGLSTAAAVFAATLPGITNTAGRLIMATLSDKIGRVSASLSLCGLTLVGAIFMTFIAGVPYIIVVAAIAFGYGGPSAINAAISTDFFGAKHSGTNYGVIMMGLGVSSVVFNSISQKLLHGASAPTFAMAAVTAVLAAGCMLVINVNLKKLR
jgi:OFA family oxalate/formate antiporter-like MFS transporter